MERLVYVIYIGATAEEIWQALTDGELTHQFWERSPPGSKLEGRLAHRSLTF